MQNRKPLKEPGDGSRQTLSRVCVSATKLVTERGKVLDLSRKNNSAVPFAGTGEVPRQLGSIR